MMNALIGNDIVQAAELIRDGGLVAFATETVYGLGANALNPLAVAGIFEAKQRPKFDPLIVHVAEKKDICSLVLSMQPLAEKLIDQFFPGPLTILFPKSELVPDIVTAGLPTVAIRSPALQQARQFIQKAGCPIAAPSANLFGQVSPTTAEHVAEQLGDKVDYILDGGPCSVGVESTVVGISPEGRLELYRPGGVSVEQIESCISEKVLNVQENPVELASPSPGLLKRHYAPRTPIMISKSPAFEIVKGEQIGLLTWKQEAYNSRFIQVELLSETGEMEECAVHFFAALRRLDQANLDRIIAVPFPEEGLGRALNDRLLRASYSKE